MSGLKDMISDLSPHDAARALSGLGFGISGAREGRPDEILNRLRILEAAGNDMTLVAWTESNPVGGVIVTGPDERRLLEAACAARCYDLDDVTRALRDACKESSASFGADFRT